MKKKLTLFSTFLLIFVFSFSVAANEPSTKELKRKVAIGRFTNETQYAKGLFYDRNNDPMRKQALDILSTKLGASGKFILLERDDLDVLLQEMQKTGGTMNNIGADYMILGSITEFGRKDEGKQGVFNSTKTQTVEAAVSIRLVDVSTGLIIYTDEAKGLAETVSKKTLGIGGSAAFDATLSDKAISGAISQLVDNIINKCMNKVWKSYFLSIDGSTAIISGGGSQGIAVGDSFNIVSNGKKVKNPQTGIIIELPGSVVGKFTVNSIGGETPETEYSLGSISDVNPAITESNLNDFHIEQINTK